ncbi:WD repeat-containing protein 86-like isoform X1 [Centruroides vittatus]|uniref:WD repeat-containing protein 86-like isoform X1 n=2 Tax=Centruroides vittatus TaxID=120091 RepID=UPI003510C575
MGCSPTKESNPHKPKHIIGKNYLLQKITEHQGGINCMALSEDGSLLVTGSDDKTARMWSTQSNPIECIGVMEGHTGYITCCVIHEQYVVTGSADHTIRKWMITTGDCVYVYEGHTSRISRVVCAGDYIFSTSSDTTARIWIFDVNDVGDLQGEACIRTLEKHTKATYPIIFLSGEKESEEEEDNYEYKSSDEDIIITGSADGTARSWSFDTGRCINTFYHNSPVNTMEADTTGDMLFTAGGDSTIRCWNIITGECIRQMRGHGGPIYTLMIHKRMLYSGSSDKTARAWAMEFGECTRVFSGHNHTVSCLRYFDGILYTASGDTLGRMFEAKSGTMKRLFSGHTNAIICMEVVSGKLFTGSYDGTIMVWDTTGVRDETVFGADIFDRNQTSEPQLEDDSEELQNAVKFLDPYIHD